MLKVENKNKQQSIIISVCLLGVALAAGLFLTLENHKTQSKLLKETEIVSNVISYEGKIAECEDVQGESCIKIGGGGKIEKLK